MTFTVLLIRMEPRISRRDVLRLAVGAGFVFLISSCSNKGGVIMIKLTKPKTEGEVSLESVIKRRRSKRSFQDKPLTMQELSQLLWAAQGITEEGGFKRAAPSGGAQYPLDLYVVSGEGSVEGLDQGVYHYLPQEHSLESKVAKDLREALARACLGQMFIAEAPVSFVITAEYRRITDRYGNRGIRYAHIEVGHVGQNIYLQAEALGMGTVAVGAFDDREVAKVLQLPPKHEPLYVMPVGYV
jgi:SagB-type dehydrogenase family enzyme